MFIVMKKNKRVYLMTKSLSCCYCDMSSQSLHSFLHFPLHNYAIPFWISLVSAKSCNVLPSVFLSANLESSSQLSSETTGETQQARRQKKHQRQQSSGSETHKETEGRGSPADWPWQRLFRCVISSCRPVSMARCSCFRRAIPLSTLATCCSSLPASMTEPPRNLHTDAGSRMTKEKGFSTALCLHYSSVPILTLTQKSAWILNVNSVRKYMYF